MEKFIKNRKYFKLVNFDINTTIEVSHNSCDFAKYSDTGVAYSIYNEVRLLSLNTDIATIAATLLYLFSLMTAAH